MIPLLLLDAGFSRNSGGWLASEAFEYLPGCPEVCASGELRALLWRHQATGGFGKPSPMYNRFRAYLDDVRRERRCAAIGHTSAQSCVGRPTTS